MGQRHCVSVCFTLNSILLWCSTVVSSFDALDAQHYCVDIQQLVSYFFIFSLHVFYVQYLLKILKILLCLSTVFPLLYDHILSFSLSYRKVIVIIVPIGMVYKLVMTSWAWQKKVIFCNNWMN